MILLLDTSTGTCKLSFIEGEWRYDNKWQADRTLADDLLRYLEEQLQKNSKSWDDISAIGVFSGPGSFTGLRIGMTVLNTLADAKEIPIVGATGDDWQSKIIERLDRGENDKIVLPLYGQNANITKPRK